MLVLFQQKNLINFFWIWHQHCLLILKWLIASQEFVCICSTRLFKKSFVNNLGEQIQRNRINLIQMVLDVAIIQYFSSRVNLGGWYLSVVDICNKETYLQRKLDGRHQEEKNIEQ
jgi:hypothetical protein